MTRTNSTCVYRCRAADGHLLYVGCSMHAATRIPQHRHKSWWAEVAAIEIQHFATVEDATAAEKLAIATEAPAHNKQRGRVITEDELAERREERMERQREHDKTSREIREKREAWMATTYPASVVCTNCGHGSDSDHLRFPRGVKVEEHQCRLCGVAAYERREAA